MVCLQSVYCALEVELSQCKHAFIGDSVSEHTQKVLVELY